jgi:hypothetical protein
LNCSPRLAFFFHKRPVAEIPYFQGESDRADRGKRHSVEQMK